MERNDGKYLEDEVQKELSKITWDRYYWRRLYDSYTAKGKALPAQPADFFTCVNGRAHHLECKTSKETNLRLKMFDQFGAMKVWDETGVTGVVITHFYTVDRLFVVRVKALVSAPSWKCDEVGTEVASLKEALLLAMEVQRGR